MTVPAGVLIEPGGAGGFDQTAVYEDLPALVHLFAVEYLVGA